MTGSLALPMAAFPPSEWLKQSLPWGLHPQHGLFHCMRRNFLLEQLPESIPRFLSWFLISSLWQNSTMRNDSFEGVHPGEPQRMGQVRILVGLCGRHAATTGLVHTIATQGTHLHHRGGCFCESHNLSELSETVVLQKRKHPAGSPNAMLLPQG